MPDDVTLGEESKCLLLGFPDKGKPKSLPNQRLARFNVSLEDPGMTFPPCWTQDSTIIAPGVASPVKKAPSVHPTPVTLHSLYYFLPRTQETRHFNEARSRATRMLRLQRLQFLELEASLEGRSLQPESPASISSRSIR